MTREELLSLLEKMIPSFHRKWNEYGGNIFDEKYGFLYNDETFFGPDWGKGYDENCTIPFVIPVDYLEGRTVETSDGIYTSKRQNKGFRKVNLSITSFDKSVGGGHSYGVLKIESPSWVDSKGGKRFGYLGSEFWNHPGFDPRISRIWEVNLCRILTQEEKDDTRVNWEYTNPGDATERFSSISELVKTALWVTLKRVSGPLKIYEGPTYVVSIEPLIEVDENDNVIFGKTFNNYFTTKEQNQLL